MPVLLSSSGRALRAGERGEKGTKTKARGCVLQEQSVQEFLLRGRAPLRWDAEPKGQTSAKPKDGGAGSALTSYSNHF